MVSVDAVVTTNKTSTSTAAVKQSNMWSAERSEVAVAEVEQGRMVGQQRCYVVGCGWWWWL